MTTLASRPSFLTPQASSNTTWNWPSDLETEDDDDLIEVKKPSTGTHNVKFGSLPRTARPSSATAHWADTSKSDGLRNGQMKRPMNHAPAAAQEPLAKKTKVEFGLPKMSSGLASSSRAGELQMHGRRAPNQPTQQTHKQMSAPNPASASFRRPLIQPKTESTSISMTAPPSSTLPNKKPTMPFLIDSSSSEDGDDDEDTIVVNHNPSTSLTDRAAALQKQKAAQRLKSERLRREAAAKQMKRGEPPAPVREAVTRPAGWDGRERVLTGGGRRFGVFGNVGHEGMGGKREGVEAKIKDEGRKRKVGKSNVIALDSDSDTDGETKYAAKLERRKEETAAAPAAPGRLSNGVGRDFFNGSGSTPTRVKARRPGPVHTQDTKERVDVPRLAERARRRYPAPRQDPKESAEIINLSSSASSTEDGSELEVIGGSGPHDLVSPATSPEPAAQVLPSQVHFMPAQAGGPKIESHRGTSEEPARKASPQQHIDSTPGPALTSSSSSQQHSDTTAKSATPPTSETTRSTASPMSASAAAKAEANMERQRKIRLENSRKLWATMKTSMKEDEEKVRKAEKEAEEAKKRAEEEERRQEEEAKAKREAELEEAAKAAEMKRDMEAKRQAATRRQYEEMHAAKQEDARKEANARRQMLVKEAEARLDAEAKRKAESERQEELFRQRKMPQTALTAPRAENGIPRPDPAARAAELLAGSAGQPKGPDASMSEAEQARQRRIRAMAERNKRNQEADENPGPDEGPVVEAPLPKGPFSLNSFAGVQRLKALQEHGARPLRTPEDGDEGPASLNRAGGPGFADPPNQKLRYDRHLGEILPEDILLLRWRQSGNEWADIVTDFEETTGQKRHKDTLRKRVKQVQDAVDGANIDRAVLQRVVNGDLDARVQLNRAVHGTWPVPKPNTTEPRQPGAVCARPAPKASGVTLGEIMPEDLKVLAWRETGNSWKDISEDYYDATGSQRSETYLRRRFQLVKDAIVDASIDASLVKRAMTGETEAREQLNRAVHGVWPPPNLGRLHGGAQRSGALLRGDREDASPRAKPSRQQSTFGPFAGPSTLLRYERDFNVGAACNFSRHYSDGPETTTLPTSPEYGVPSVGRHTARPTTGGKIMTEAVFQHYLAAQAEAFAPEPEAEEEVEDEEPSFTTEDYCHWTYQVQRRELTKEEMNDDIEIETKRWTAFGQPYESLHRANAAAAKQALIAHDQNLNDAILTNDDSNLHQGKDKDGCKNFTLSLSKGIVQVQVQQCLRTYQDHIRPSNTISWVNRTCYFVRQRTVTKLPVTDDLFEDANKESVEEVNVDDTAYTTLELANTRAIEHFVSLTFTSTSARLDLRELQIVEERKRFALELEEEGEEAYFEKVAEDGETAVEVKVVLGRISGPRNL